MCEGTRAALHRTLQVLWDVTLGLFCGVSSGEDIRLSISEVLTSRTFCNKMWQTLRFTLGVLGDNTTPLRTLEEVHQNRLVLLMKLRHNPGFRPSEELRKLLEKLRVKSACVSVCCRRLP